jgi:predicted anti-sigma-YlaC factor YlaD
MRENTHFDAWIEGVHFHLGACAATRTWYAYTPNRMIRFAGVGDMDQVIPSVRLMLTPAKLAARAANGNATAMVPTLRKLQSPA